MYRILYNAYEHLIPMKQGNTVLMEALTLLSFYRLWMTSPGFPRQIELGRSVVKQGHRGRPELTVHVNCAALLQSEVVV